MSERLAVVMPVYNEEEAIGPFLRKWAEALSRLGIDYTIFAYNDGSKDHSLEVMRSVAEEYPGKITPVDKPNSGHGPTILLGYRQAAAAGFDWVFQIDSDDEMGPESFSQLWDARGDKDFLVGWRDGRTQALPRKLISAVSRASVRLLYGKGIHDVNTPYRLMRVSAFREAYESIPPDTFAPNVILTGIAARESFRDAQFEVPQRDRQTGEVSIKKWKLAKVAMKSFWQTIVYSSEHYRRVGLALLMLVFVLVAFLNIPPASHLRGD
ncbi:MAG: glycosyltransferase family 2 protein, partial [Thermoguttaceae bacterium]|nr:glycosyltransferase family 2 protein [Thermoguttaceae bacterium]